MKDWTIEKGRVDVMLITPDSVANILESAWEMRNEVVPCLLGEPGIGKTQGIYRFAESKGAKVVEIIASQILPNEVSGITMPVNKTHRMEIYDHVRLSSLEDGDILFFDELLQASPQTLSACLTLIQERRMMSGRMLPDIMIVAAANPLNSPNMVPLSIRQRFMFIHVEFSPEQYTNYMLEKFGIRIHHDLLSRIRFKTDQYNALTPRTLTKLLLWGQKVGSEDPGFTQAVCNMFDSSTYTDIVKSLTPDEKTQLEKALYDFEFANGGKLNRAVIKRIMSENMKDMLDAIKRLPDSEEILEYLSGIEIQEV